MKKCTFYGIFLSFLLALTAHAESDIPPFSEKSGEETVLFGEIPSVYGASKYEQKVTQAPSSVSIVTGEEIKKYGYRTLADILKSTRSFYSSYDRNYHYIGVRGFERPGDYNTRILVLVDGHRINDNIYDQAPVGADFPIDVDLIDRVEIIRGPSSSIYGNNAFFGVINVLTKKGRDFKGVETSGEVGSQDTYKLRLSYGDRFYEKLEVLFSASAYTTNGDDRLYFKEFDDPASNAGIAENCDEDEFYSAFSKVSFSDFALEAVHARREKEIPTAPWGIAFNDSRNKTVDRRSFVNLKYEHTLPWDLDSMARIYYDRYEYEGNYVYDVAGTDAPPNLIQNKDNAEGEWWGLDLQMKKDLFERHKILIGGEYRDSIRQNQENHDKSPYYSYLDDRQNLDNWAFFIQDEFRIFDNLLLNAGVRYDHYDTFGGTTNPRIGLIYSPFPASTLKLLYGRAFRAPNAYELYYHDGDVTQKANPNLDPETIDTYEVVLEQYFGTHLRAVAAGFYYKIEDLISQTSGHEDGLLVFENVDQVEAKGFELELYGKWEGGLEGQISYSYQDTENKETGATLTNSPKHLAKLSLIVPVLKEKLFSGIELQYVSRRKNFSGNYSDDYIVANLTLFAKYLIPGLELSGSIYNVFDKDYADPGSGEHLQDVIEQDGRLFRVKLTYSF